MIRPHKNEWNGLRRKYWNAHVNFSRNHKARRRRYWQNEVKRLAARLSKLSNRYPPLKLGAGTPIKTMIDLKKALR